MTQLEKYYSKHKEENRLLTRHGTVEFEVAMKYILDSLPKDEDSRKKTKIVDIGAGTGRYSVALSRMGFDVTAVELVKHNLDILESKHEHVKLWPGDARDLHFLEDEKFDCVIFFGPLYHLHGDEEKLKAFNEAKRVCKKGGLIFAGYVMNDYSLVSYCFQENRIGEIMARGALDEDFHIKCTEADLYDYARIEDLDRLNAQTGLERIKLFSPDGPADYMRRELNAMTEESFRLFIQYQMKNAERKELLGAGSHIVDVLKKN